MSNSRKLIVSISALVSSLLVAAPTHAAIFAFQAESGILGSGWDVELEAGALGSAITTATDSLQQSPSSVNSVATYMVDLPAGSYNLYARFLVGPTILDSDGKNDSFLIGNGFGTKALGDNNQWIRANGLGPVDTPGLKDADGNSITAPTAAPATDGIFNWVNLTTSALSSKSEDVPEFVSTGGIQVFQIATREIDFYIDAFAWVPVGETPSSSQLTAAAVPELSNVLGVGLLLGGGLMRRRGGLAKS